MAPMQNARPPRPAHHNGLTLVVCEMPDCTQPVGLTTPADMRVPNETKLAVRCSSRFRSARAESRCQKLVAELRTTVRAVVDGHQTGLGENEPLELLLNKNTVREIATNRDRQSRLSARWEQQRLRERTASQLELKAVERSRQAMRQQLALPGMPASLVADR